MIKGRLNRKGYLVFWVVVFSLLLLIRIDGGVSGGAYVLVALAVLWAQFVADARRLHDFGLSGAYALLRILPFVLMLLVVIAPKIEPYIKPLAFIWIIVVNVGGTFVLLLYPGNKGENRFGSPPKWFFEDGQQS